MPGLRSDAVGGTVAEVPDVVGRPADPASEHPVVARLALEGTLASQVRRGVAWSAASRVLLVAAQLGGAAVLARLLLPDDFGLVALGAVVNGLAALFSRLGLATAVVQAPRVTGRLLSTAFWLSTLVGLLVTLLLVALAPLVAGLYDEPRLTGLLRVSALAFALNLAVVPMALLQRSLRFKQLAGYELAGVVVGLGTTVALALGGAGAYSLVIGPVVQVACTGAAVWATVRWVPRGFVHRRELGELWRFGRGLTGTNLLTFAARNTDTVLLGQVVGFGQLGLYSRAYNIMMMPLQQVTLVLSRAMLPAYAQMRDDPARLRRSWLTAVRASLLLGVPAGLGVAAAAPAVVETLYGPRWTGAVTVLVLLSASLPPQLVTRNSGPLYQALGRTGLEFRVAVVSSAVTVGGTVVGLAWGIEGVAAALLVTSWVALVVTLVPLLRLVGLRAGELWRAVRGLLLAGAAMALAALGAGAAVDGLPAPAVLAVQAAAGGLVYLGVLQLVDREALAPVLHHLRRGGRLNPARARADAGS